jgi:hypothetical protein
MANEEHVALLKQGWAAAIGLMALGLMRPQVMTTDDLLTLRNVLGLRRRALLDRLATDTGGIIEPAYVSLLADTHAAIAAVGAELVEMEGGA